MEKFLRSNNFARALALFLAIILWLFVAGDSINRTTPERKLVGGVPLQYENLGEGYLVTSMQETVDVYVEGLPDAMDDLTVEEIDAYVDLAGKEPGVYVLQVKGRVPRGLTLLTFYPEKVEVVIEEYQSGLFPVEIEFHGNPASGWVVETVRFEKVVRIEGPGTLFDRIRRVVLNVDLGVHRNRYQARLAPLVLDDQGEEITGLTISPKELEVEVIIAREKDKEENGEEPSEQ